MKLMESGLIKCFVLNMVSLTFQFNLCNIGKSIYVCPLDYVTNTPWTEKMFAEYVKRESETVG